MPEDILPFVEYGALGIFAGVILYLGRQYTPIFQQLAVAIAALAQSVPQLADASTAIATAVKEQSRDLRTSLDDLRTEVAEARRDVAVIKDRAGRPTQLDDPELLRRLLAERLRERRPAAGD